MKFVHRLRPHLSRVLLVCFFVLPITVATLYMLALWDPAPKLREVPLAIVNEDAGATINGEQKNIGRDTTDNLLNTEYLNFKEVSAAEADKGLEETNYLFTVHIPKDYSESIGSLMTPNPRPAEITITYNDYNGTAGAVLTNGVAPKLKERINTALAESYSKAILSGMNELRAGLGRAAEGASLLDAGAHQLNDGAKQLNEGAGRLADGTAQLADGSNQILSGTDRLADGVSQVSGGVEQLNSRLIPLLQSLQGSAPQLEQASTVLRTLGRDEQANKLHELSRQLSADNPSNLVANLNRLDAGTKEILFNLADNSAPYRGGLNRLRDGIHQANDGAHQLHDGTQRLIDGSGRLADGAAQLHNGLQDGFTRAPVFRDVNGTAAQIAKAVHFKEVNLHPAKTLANTDDPTSRKADAGASLLITLVFGFLIMFLIATVMPDLPRGVTSVRDVRGQGLKLFGVNGVAMALLCIMASTLNWRPDNLPLIALVLIMVVASNTAVLLLLKTLWNRYTAAVLSITLFLLGLFSFGGVWPISTVPSVFKVIRPLHWMTYQRTAFIRASSGDIDASFFISLAVLVAVTIGCIVVARVVTRRSYLFASSDDRNAEEPHETEAPDAINEDSTGAHHSAEGRKSVSALASEVRS